MDKSQPGFIVKVAVQLLIVVVLIPFLPMVISGHWGWWEAWVFAAISILGFAVSRVLAARKHPDLLAERAHSMEHKNIKPWDKILAPIVGVGSGLIPLAAGLDALSGLPAPFSLGVKILAMGLILGGYALATYALIENSFFSGVVRIQSERGHRVISSGPYAWVRHPGYSGSLAAFLATPLLLDSTWAFLPAVVVTICLVIRTSLEDRFLQEELPGYREYAQRARYRLIPGIW